MPFYMEVVWGKPTTPHSDYHFLGRVTAMDAMCNNFNMDVINKPADQTDVADNIKCSKKNWQPYVALDDPKNKDKKRYVPFGAFYTPHPAQVSFGPAVTEAVRFYEAIEQ
jgi:hypothetical protein